MKKLISLIEWNDLVSGHTYQKGEPYPFDGKTSKKRIAELCGSENRAGFPLIEEVEVEEESEEA